MKKFIGRKEELRELRALRDKKSSSLVVVTGRRRIGKSRFVNEAGADTAFFAFSGIPPEEGVTAQSQRDEFATQLALQTKKLKLNSDGWTELFYALSQEVKTGKVMILFDEVSWMADGDKTFLGKLKNLWDMHLSKNHELILVLCGSISSWIDENILSSTGFMGRISLRLHLEELSLPECNEFWPKRPQTSAYEKLQLLSVTGGVPRYLEAINHKQTSAENIASLCFQTSGLLYHEFNDIFSDLFSRRSETYHALVKTLSDGPKTLSRICELAGLHKGGTISRYLDDLVQAGFLKKEDKWSLRSGLSTQETYRLSDNYLRFYIKYIEPNSQQIEKGLFKSKSITSLTGYSAMMGLQVENLVLNNQHQVFEILGLPLEDIENTGPYHQQQTKRQRGCQVDLLIQLKFNILYLCEIKFSKSPIGCGVIDEIERKIAAMNCKQYSFKPVLIHVNGVTEDLEESGYFARIIGLDELL